MVDHRPHQEAQPSKELAVLELHRGGSVKSCEFIHRVIQGRLEVLEGIPQADAEGHLRLAEDMDTQELSVWVLDGLVCAALGVCPEYSLDLSYATLSPSEFEAAVTQRLG
jgi:hypothetical protein